MFSQSLETLLGSKKSKGGRMKTFGTGNQETVRNPKPTKTHVFAPKQTARGGEKSLVSMLERYRNLQLPASK